MFSSLILTFGHIPTIENARQGNKIFTLASIIVDWGNTHTHKGGCHYGVRLSLLHGVSINTDWSCFRGIGQTFLKLDEM